MDLQKYYRNHLQHTCGRQHSAGKKDKTMIAPQTARRKNLNAIKAEQTRVGGWL